MGAGAGQFEAEEVGVDCVDEQPGGENAWFLSEGSISTAFGGCHEGTPFVFRQRQFLQILSEDEKRGLSVKAVFLVGEVLGRRGFVEAVEGFVLGDAEMPGDEARDFGDEGRPDQVVLTHSAPRSCG